MPEQESIQGAVERVTYYNEENGYSVVKIITDEVYPEATNYDGTVTVVGIMPELISGESARFIGEWVENARYGRQFKADRVIPVPPNNRDGIIRYLSSGLVSGIGPVTAERIVEHFGDETLQILDSQPQRIYEVSALKTTLADALVEAWERSRSERQVMIHLQSYGISSRFARRIYEQYGTQTVAVIKTDPYQLADDIFGIGFKKADTIAQGMGMALDSPQRLRSGLIYALEQLAREGHTYAPREVLIEACCSLLDVDEREGLSIILDDLTARESVYHEQITDQEAIYLPVYYHAERGSQRLLAKIAHTESFIQHSVRNTDWSWYLSVLAQQNNVSLTEQQQGAVKAALLSKITVLTGGPGTGKTTTLQMVIHALRAENISFSLASPTGRAAKRLSEATGEQAMTIHRMLGFGDGGFEHDEDNPLKLEMLIVDEASMIDLVLLYNLLRALPPSAHLMLVGDIDQLPSVGAGNVLRDVIDSGVASVTRLDQIFRQAEASHIVVNAHRINAGELPYTDNQSDDFFFFGIEEPAAAADMVVEIVQHRLSARFGEVIDRFEDIQVIAPMYRGPIGVHALNRALQSALNGGPPRDSERRLNGFNFRVGDKVMQTRNNYDKEVFNGDIGRITAVYDDDNVIRVQMGDAVIDYDYSEADQLIHAYCISTHRSQGSEYPYVVMPVMTQHYMMLQRNLLYTAITRAREVVVLVGDRKALGMAVRNNKVAERYSGLLYRLQHPGR